MTKGLNGYVSNVSFPVRNVFIGMTIASLTVLDSLASQSSPKSV